MIFFPSRRSLFALSAFRSPLMISSRVLSPTCAISHSRYSTRSSRQSRRACSSSIISPPFDKRRHQRRQRHKKGDLAD
nr:MAG TPA: hypothetical protein [Caudoviricetes sp.]